MCLGMLALGGAALAAREAPFKQAHRGLYPRIVLAKNKGFEQARKEKENKIRRKREKKRKRGNKKNKVLCGRLVWQPCRRTVAEKGEDPLAKAKGRNR